MISVNVALFKTFQIISFKELYDFLNAYSATFKFSVEVLIKDFC